MLDRAGIAKLAQQRLERFVARQPAHAYQYSFKITSGTTSEPLLSILDNPPRYFESLSSFRNYFVCHASRNIRLANALYVRYQKTQHPLRVLLLDPADLVPGFESLLADFSPDGIRGLPSLIIRASEHVPIPITSGVAKMHLAGELFTEARVAFLREHFPKTEFSCMYMSAEIGMISEVPCGRLPFNYYHPRAGVVVEIDAPEQGGAGALLITTTLEEGIDVVRYRIGDSGRWHSERCSCGNPLTFEVLGREGYDYIKILGCVVRAEEGERIFAKYRELFDSYRIELEEIYRDNQVRGKLTLRVHGKRALVSDSEISAFIDDFNNSFFMTPTKTLAMLVHEGVFEPLVFLQESEPLPQGPKDYPLRFKK